jgi:hypothetical protein
VWALRIALSAVYGIDSAIRGVLARHPVRYALANPLALASVFLPPVRVIFSLRLARVYIPARALRPLPAGRGGANAQRRSRRIRGLSNNGTASGDSGLKNARLPPLDVRTPERALAAIGPASNLQSKEDSGAASHYRRLRPTNDTARDCVVPLFLDDIGMTVEIDVGSGGVQRAKDARAFVSDFTVKEAGRIKPTSPLGIGCKLHLLM